MQKKLKQSTNIQRNMMYICFAIAAIVVCIIFVTATTYIQLAIATLLYPPLVYFAFVCFTPKQTIAKPENIFVPETKPIKEKENIEIADIDKRAFLKMIGAAGLSYFIFSIFTKRAENLLLGTSSGGLQNKSGKQIDPAEKQPTDGYKITEIFNDEFTYYGFVNKDGAWYIMKEDPQNGSFRYAKGDANFPDGWNNRENIQYDYFHNVFS